MGMSINNVNLHCTKYFSAPKPTAHSLSASVKPYIYFTAPSQMPNGFWVAHRK